jgi:predicted metal-binding protein
VAQTPGAITVQITADSTLAMRALDEVQQVLHVGFFAYIRRLGVTRCGTCGKRRVCYAIEVTVVPGETSQIVGHVKCAEHSGIR